MKSMVKVFGYSLVVAGFLLFLIVILNLPGGYWSKGAAEIRWYKFGGLELVNGKIQSSSTNLGKGDPTSEELTQFAIQADPSFFTGCPVNVMIDLPSYQKGSELANYLISNGRESATGAGLLEFKIIPNPPHSRYGYIGAIASVVIGLILIIAGRRMRK